MRTLLCGWTAAGLLCFVFVSVAVAKMTFGPDSTCWGRALQEQTIRRAITLVKRAGHWKRAHFQNTAVEPVAERDDAAHRDRKDGQWSPKMPSDEQDVRRTVQAFYDAFNSHNWSTAARFATEDWTHINPGGGITRGREAVLKELRKVHASFLQGVTDTPEEMEVRRATQDVAVVTVPSKMLGTFTTPDGRRHENDRQIRTFVVVRREGRWRIMQDQNTIRTN